LIGVIFVSFWLSSGQALENGLARTPPMGWNSWNHFKCNTSEITQYLFVDTATAMAKSGMKAAGYEYINIDDCWLGSTRDSSGQLQPDLGRFPDGIQAVIQYIHSLGLKFGIYEDSGPTTCAGYPGSLGHYAQDAKTFADWGVDYVKLDGCNTDVSDMKTLYTEFGQAINQSGRPMVYSCSWPAYANVNNISVPYDYVVSICNLWREWNDVTDSWYSWTAILDFQESANLAPWAGPGHWNDPDMLEIGNGNQTDTEYRSLFSMWAMLAAPLIAGNDLRNMTKETIEILTAPEVIAVDQDPLGKQGKRVWQNKVLHEVWARPLADGSIAVALFNRDKTAAAITAQWTEIGLKETDTAMVRDLWRRSDLGTSTGNFTGKILPHAVQLLKITKQK